MAYGIQVVVDRPHAAVVPELKAALVGEGLAVVTSVDLREVLERLLDVEVPPQVVLGVCSPTLAVAALHADASVGLLVPCNVVVRAVTDTCTVVEAANPALMVAVTGNPELEPVAADTTARLQAALDILQPAA